MSRILFLSIPYSGPLVSETPIYCESKDSGNQILTGLWRFLNVQPHEIFGIGSSEDVSLAGQKSY